MDQGFRDSKSLRYQEEICLVILGKKSGAETHFQRSRTSSKKSSSHQEFPVQLIKLLKHKNYIIQTATNQTWIYNNMHIYGKQSLKL